MSALDRIVGSRGYLLLLGLWHGQGLDQELYLLCFHDQIIDEFLLVCCGVGSGSQRRSAGGALTLEDFWRVELVRVSLFGYRYVWADLTKGGSGGEVGDGARHDHQKLGIVSVCTGRSGRPTLCISSCS